MTSQAREPRDRRAAGRAALAAPLLAVALAGAQGERPAAHVTHVEVRGSAGSYLFRVTVESPDTGCEQYADWWEVVSPEGELLYRRILEHSHVGEQPFTRSGGPIALEAEREVIVRAHMNTGGYGGRALRGSAASGFRQDPSGHAFAEELESQAPLPQGCAR
jgi:hypothetical protein